MEAFLLIIFICVLWGLKVLNWMLILLSYVAELVFYRIPTAIIKAVKKSKKQEKEEEQYIVEVNVTVTYEDGTKKRLPATEKKIDIYPFSDDECDIGYNMEMADILFGDD